MVLLVRHVAADVLQSSTERAMLFASDSSHHYKSEHSFIRQMGKKRTISGDDLCKNAVENMIGTRCRESTLP